MKESPVFTRTHDLVHYLMLATRKFPREQRFVLARRVQEQAFALQDALNAAAIDRARQREHLIQADIALNGLRKSLWLCYEMDLLDASQYRHASMLDGEVGRLLGGWRKSVG